MDDPMLIMDDLPPEQPPPGKRSRKSITLDTKLKIINRRENGERMSEIARSLGLNTSTVRTILDNADRLKLSVAPGNSRRITKTRDLAMERMENALIMWVKEQNVPPNSVRVCRRAKVLWLHFKLKEGDTLGEKPFKASHGWFERFKRRSNLWGTCSEEETKSPGLEGDFEPSLRVANLPKENPEDFQDVKFIDCDVKYEEEDTGNEDEEDALGDLPHTSYPCSQPHRSDIGVPPVEAQLSESFEPPVEEASCDSTKAIWDNSDPNCQFLMSCLPSLSRLPARKRELAKLQIQKLLFDLEFGDANLHNGGM